ncbi:MAG: hypothetical protein JXR86_16530 [Spirochaetales bacterium]|nr:hypothetical protein [Spirochaetales bacterium]
MNRLLKKIREFGLILSFPDGATRAILPLTHALNKSHLPLVLIPFSGEEEKDIVKEANEKEDLFIGSDCPASPAAIEKSFGSGAHFALCSAFEDDRLPRLKESGLDIFMRVTSRDEIDLAVRNGAGALVINSETENICELINYASSQIKYPFFLEGPFKSEISRKWQLIPDFIAWICPFPLISLRSGIDERGTVERQAYSMIRSLLGIRYRALILKRDSPERERAECFCALSAIPLLDEGERVCLEIEVFDMDRTIAHLKWRNIYMDPLSAEMNGATVVSTDLYENFMGWPVRLLSGRN